MTQAFHPSNPDFTLSPYTGLTRESWIEAGRHLLAGVFRNIKQPEDPVVLPRAETEITYPHAGSLLQFLTREDFYYKGVPTMGFYGQFSPLVQGYSCAESPYWMGKAFLCLDLPADHPFWTAREENGSWENLRPEEVKTTVLEGPALAFSNHKANRATILRTGKIVKNCGDRHGMWNYGKLTYHSRYPWEATPNGDSAEYIAETEHPRDSEEATLNREHDTEIKHPRDSEEVTGGASLDKYSVESQQYVLTDDTDGREELANVTLWSGERRGVLYRRQFFNYTLDKECMWMQALNLADFPVSGGIMRADRLRLYRRPVTLTLGAWGFPDNGTEIVRKSEGRARAIILKGTDSLGRPKQLAMTIYDGWDELHIRKSTGTNPESKHSLVVYAITKRKKQYGGAESYVLISQTLTKESGEDFTDEELFPISEIIYSDMLKVGGFGAVTIRFKNGEEKVVDYTGIEGTMFL